MAGKTKKGKKMFKGPGWKIKSSSGLRFSGTLREVLHVGKGKMVAIFYMRKRKTAKA
jgi:hypothetical protein